MSTQTINMGGMFGVDCTGCGGEADVDVEVINRETGETARDVYACEDCADDISVPSAFAVVTTEL
jgi:uncharacterized Zn finger protein